MTRPRLKSPIFRGKRSVQTNGFAGVAALIMLAFANASLCHAQSPVSDWRTAAGSPSTPVFDVASIKSDKEARGMYTFGWFSPGTFSTTGATVYRLIRLAYAVQDNQISGAPAWINSERFDIQAKTNESVTAELLKRTEDQRTLEYRQMLQQLLMDRFKLTVHHESRELPVYALVVAKNGPKLQEAKAGDAYPNGIEDANGNRHAGVMHAGPGELIVQGLPIASLAEQLSNQSELTDRVVLDETGLDSIYDFTLKWTPESRAPAVIQGPENAPMHDSSGTSIFTAIQEQLGLRLESTKAPVDTIVIDHIEQPSEN